MPDRMGRHLVRYSHSKFRCKTAAASFAMQSVLQLPWDSGVLITRAHVLALDFSGQFLRAVVIACDNVCFQYFTVLSHVARSTSLKRVGISSVAFLVSVICIDPLVKLLSLMVKKNFKIENVCCGPDCYIIYL